MKRTLILLLSLSLLLTACTSAPQQVTVTPEATVTATPPPTQTPIPTPTFHPAFVDLQSHLADLGLTLLPDGTIEMTAGGERRTVPNLLVSPEGIISLTLKDGTVVTVAPEDMSVDEAGGLKIKGYEWDSEQGGWVEAISQAMQQTTALLEQYNIDRETVTIIEEGGAVNVVDNETGKVLIRTIGENSKFDLGFAVDTIAKNSCEPTKFIPSRSGLMLAENGDAPGLYFEKIMIELNYQRYGGARIWSVLIDREQQCWGSIYDGKDLLYRDAEGLPRRLPLIGFSRKEVEAFIVGR